MFEIRQAVLNDPSQYRYIELLIRVDRDIPKANHGTHLPSFSQIQRSLDQRQWGNGYGRQESQTANGVKGERISRICSMTVLSIWRPGQPNT